MLLYSKGTGWCVSFALPTTHVISFTQSLTSTLSAEDKHVPALYSLFLNLQSNNYPSSTLIILCNNHLAEH